MTARTFPPGTFQYLRDAGAFRPVVWCDRCGRMVSKWHEHLTKPGEALVIMPDLNSPEYVERHDKPLPYGGK